MYIDEKNLFLVLKISFSNFDGRTFRTKLHQSIFLTISKFEGIPIFSLLFVKQNQFESRVRCIVLLTAFPTNSYH